MRRGWVRGSALALALLGAGIVHAEPASPAVEPASPAAEPASPAVEPASPAAEPATVESKSPVVSDGPVAVTTRLSPDPSNVGDLLLLEVVAAYPRDVRVNLPTRLAFEPLHHVSTEEGEAEPTGDGLRKTFRIALQCFEVGSATIPSFPLTYVDAEGAVHTVQIPARTFTVESLLANEADPQRRGEDPPISREYPDTLAETVVLSVLATLLLALLVWLGVRRFGPRRVAPAPPPIPAHEVAFEALDELERGELLAHGQVQRYYVELTEIAKGYIEGRFGLDALDRTTDEIRRALITDGKRLAPLSAEGVVEFLQHCDLVKFARFTPPDEESHEALQTVREMVKCSVPVAAPKPEAKTSEPEAKASEPEAKASELGAKTSEPEAKASEREAKASVAAVEVAEPEVAEPEVAEPEEASEPDERSSHDSSPEVDAR